MKIITLQYIFRYICLTLSLGICTQAGFWVFYPKYPFKLYHFSTSRNNSEEAYTIMYLIFFCISHSMSIYFNKSVSSFKDKTLRDIEVQNVTTEISFNWVVKLKGVCETKSSMGDNVSYSYKYIFTCQQKHNITSVLQIIIIVVVVNCSIVMLL